MMSKEYQAEPELEPTWPELLGSSNWEGLLEPLDLSLRKLILRCGDLCQATYDKNSKYCGSCRYGKRSFFHKVMFEAASDYQVTSYLYATASLSLRETQTLLVRSKSKECWDSESNWIGYIAVTNDEVSKALGRREIYVAWRGTISKNEWINVLGDAPVSAIPLLNHSGSDSHGKSPNVMRGWLRLYISESSN